VPPEPEPPAGIRLTLDDALRLLGSLEDARDALIDSRHLTVVADIEDQVRLLSRRLGFDEPDGSV
jgi:hypothetical protein